MRVRLLLGMCFAGGRVLLRDVCCWGMCLRHKQLDVNNYFTDCRLGGQCHRQGVSISIYYSGNGRGEVLEKDLGCARNSKELIVGWEHPRLQVNAGSLVVPKPACKGKLRVFG